MARKKLSDSERIERRRIALKKYKQSEKGKEKQKESNKKYQQTDSFKQYKKEYYERKNNNYNK